MLRRDGSDSSPPDRSMVVVDWSSVSAAATGLSGCCWLHYRRSASRRLADTSTASTGEVSTRASFLPPAPPCLAPASPAKIVCSALSTSSWISCCRCCYCCDSGSISENSSMAGSAVAVVADAVAIVAFAVCIWRVGS